ncbi:MAG: hypothetical protein E7Z68_03975 [Thermoplasmata archaeon]|nr:hypothetical protein [Thermoplasmata archaeon]
MKNIKLQILSESDLDKIHKATLRVMSEAGIQVRLKEARDIFRANGCSVDDETGIVRIPAQVAEKALACAPPSFMLYDRDGEPAFELTSDGSVVRNLTFATGTRIIEYEAPGKYSIRDSTLRDIEDMCAVVDKCDNINWICSAPIAAMDKTTDPCVHLLETQAVMKNTKKPQLVEAIPDFVDELYEMQAIARGKDIKDVIEKPYIVSGACPTSPLTIDANVCRQAIVGAKYDMPIMSLSCGMGGATTPIFLAGTLVTHNAEVLALIILAELVKPGTKVVYGSSTNTFDFFNNSTPVGSPELALISAAVGELAQYYKIPAVVAGT